MIKAVLKKRLVGSDKEFLLDVKFEIAKGEFISLFGPSGAGKTSILRMLAGLLSPEQGFISVNDSVWTDPTNKINLKPQLRKVGLVFQDYALFPNMTVRENLEFVLPDKRDKDTIEKMLELVSLSNLADRKPSSLSGGQQQRVALARALVRKPELLLLDEPLSALDNTTRISLQDDLLKIHKELGLTTILISHDISEVYKLSDRIIELKNGLILKEGSPSDFFQEKQISGKVQLTGSVLEIIPQEIVFIVKVVCGNSIVNVIATEPEVNDLRVGDKVLIAMKAFNPLLIKLS